VTDEEIEAQQEQFRECVRQIFGELPLSVEDMMLVAFSYFPDLTAEVLTGAIEEES
jgi:tRNA A37 threonylcarbamoyltransferase TsaD